MKSVFDTVAIEVVASTIPNGLQELNEEYLNIPQKDIDKITNITGISKVALAADQIRHQIYAYNLLGQFLKQILLWQVR